MVVFPVSMTDILRVSSVDSSNSFCIFVTEVGTLPLRILCSFLASLFN